VDEDIMSEWRDDDGVEKKKKEEEKGKYCK